jgi:hypothetical protein
MAKFAQGKFPMKNPDKYIGKKSPTYRSSWEFAFMKLCDEHPNVTQWASEAIQIPYRNPITGKMTIYVPDFFLNYTDKNGKIIAELIEVKPRNQTVMELARDQGQKMQVVKNQAKWSAASDWCKHKRIRFRVVTEEELFHNGSR